MNFELKKVEPMGGVSLKDDNTSTQLLSITVGVVGCPYDDIKTTKMITYEFSNAITVAEARAGIETFASAWVTTTYPNID